MMAFDFIVKTMLKDPESWEECGYTIQHKSGLSVWISGGLFHYRGYKPVSLKFSFFQKIRFSSVLNEWRDLKVSKKIINYEKEFKVKGDHEKLL